MMKSMRRTRMPALCATLLVCAAAAQGQNKAQSEAEVTFNTALTHLREGRLEDALDTFKKAIKQDGKNPYIYKGLGVAYAQYAAKCPASDAGAKCRAERYAEAVAAARRALELNQYYVDARNDLGAWLLLSGKREEGRKELKAAYEDPTNPTPEHSARNLGESYYVEKNYPLAQTWFQAAVSRNDRYGDAYVWLGEALLQQAKVGEAITALEAGAKILPDDASVQLVLGQAYYRAGRFSDARARWEGVAAKDAGGAGGRRALELLKTLQR